MSLLLGWIVDLNKCLKQAFETRDRILGQAGRGEIKSGKRLWNIEHVGIMVGIVGNRYRRITEK